jgi:hypothetical protein
MTLINFLISTSIIQKKHAIVITVPVGQGRRKISLKIDAKILGKLFFQKMFFLNGKNKNLQE